MHPAYSDLTHDLTLPQLVAATTSPSIRPSGALDDGVEAAGTP